MITLDEMNRCVALFGANQKDFMRSERRTTLRSVLFDVPRRSSIGWHCVYEAAVPLLRELDQHISPEATGRRMRRLCSRPYYLTLSILMCSYFGARQQLMLDRGLNLGDPLPGETPAKIEEARYLVDFWKRVTLAYRNDGLLLPAEGGYTQPILPPEAVAQLAAQLKPSTEQVRHSVRRLAASLELYGFILHGEQRDGLFAHGPYPQPDGTTIVFHEFTDLQNDFLPWAATAASVPYPNLAIVLRLKDVKTRFDLFGSVLYDPADLSGNVLAEGLFTCAADGSVRPVAWSEVSQLQHCAADAHNELYLKAAEWTPRYKVEYGMYLFANHVREFFRIAGLGSQWDATIRTRFQLAAEPLIEPMLADPDPPSMWSFMATTEGAFFWPVVASRTQEESTVG